MADTTKLLARWSISPAVIYLTVGFSLGPAGFELLDPVLPEDRRRIGAIAEIALLAVLFCVGLRLRAPLVWSEWRLPLRLATIGGLSFVLLAAAAAHALFGLSFAAGLLLGAVLLPTDPVLASQVQLPVGRAGEEVRHGLTAEAVLSTLVAGLPVLFALGLLGAYELGFLAARWAFVDVGWGFAAAIVIGWTLGRFTVRWLERLDRDAREAFPEELALVALAIAVYLLTVVAEAHGPVAVLAAGLAVSHRGTRTGRASPGGLTPRMLRLAHGIERIASAAALLLVGALLAVSDLRVEMFVFALVVLVLVRPLAVRVGFGAQWSGQRERQVVGWFGLRGIGSLYYLMLASEHGLAPPLMRDLTGLTLATLAISIVLHGLSALPLASGRLRQASR